MVKEGRALTEEARKLCSKKELVERREDVNGFGFQENDISVHAFFERPKKDPL